MEQNNSVSNDVIDSEIERLEKVFYGLKGQEIEISNQLTNMNISQEYDTFPKIIDEDWMMIESLDLKRIIDKLDDKIEERRQILNINRIKNKIIQEQDESIGNLDELNENTKLHELQCLKDLLQKLVDLKNEQSVLIELIKPLQNKNTANSQMEWLSEF